MIWDQSQLLVEDQVAAPAAMPAVMLFPRHLGTDHTCREQTTITTELVGFGMYAIFSGTRPRVLIARG